MPHPIQDMYDDQGTLRFRPNLMVRFLLDRGPFDMNDLAAMEFSLDDREQFAQLIGYSLGGFSELSYVSDKTYERAKQKASKLICKDKQEAPCPATTDPAPTIKED